MLSETFLEIVDETISSNAAEVTSRKVRSPAVHDNDSMQPTLTTIPSFSVILRAELQRRNCNTSYSCVFSCLANAPKDVADKLREIVSYFIQNMASLRPMIDEDISLDSCLNLLDRVYRQYDSVIEYLKEMKGTMSLTPSKTMGVVALGASVDAMPSTAMYLGADGVKLSDAVISGDLFQEWFDKGAVVCKSPIAIDGIEASKQLVCNALARTIMNTGVLSRKYYGNPSLGDESNTARLILEDGRYTTLEQRATALAHYIANYGMPLPIDYDYLDKVAKTVQYDSLNSGTKIGTRTYKPSDLLGFCSEPALSGLAGMSAKGVRKSAFKGLAQIYQNQGIAVYSLGMKDCGIPLVIMSALDPIIEDDPNSLKVVMLYLTEVPREGNESIGAGLQRLISTYSKKRVLFIVGSDISKLPLSQSGYYCMGWSIVDPCMEFALFAFSGGLGNGPSKTCIGSIRWRSDVLRAAVLRGISYISFLAHRASPKADDDDLYRYSDEGRIGSAAMGGSISSVVDFFRVYNTVGCFAGAYVPRPDLFIKVADLSRAASAVNAIINYDDDDEVYDVGDLFEGTGLM